jgi:signal peptidase
MRIGREALLWVSSVLGSLCLLALLAGWALGVTPLVFSSGSMSPAYDAGALGIAREVPASDLAVGDVVSVVNNQGDRVTHRIVEVARQGDEAVLTLMGDTNNVPDVQAYTVDSADRVVFGVPLAGYVVNAASSPFGLGVAGLLAVTALVLGFSRNERDEGGRPGRARAAVPAGVVSVLALGGVLGATGQAPWAFTSAYWTDSAQATTTATTPAPVTHAQPSCTSKSSNPGAQRATITWTAVGTQYEYYWAFYREGIAAPQLTGTVGTGVAPPTQVTISNQLQIPSGGGGNANYYVTVQTRLVSDHSNVGSPTTTLLIAGPLPGGPNWAVFCRP